MHRLLVRFGAPPPTTLRIEGESFHHLIHVLRAKVGGELELFDGTGRACRARLERVDEAGADVSVLGEVSAPPLRPVTLLQGLPKGERWDFVLQKGSELGARTFLPIDSARTVAKVEPSKRADRRARWQKVAEEAARQCGRADVPEVAPLQSLAGALATLPPTTRLVVLDEEERTRSLREVLEALPNDVPLAFAVGPEGGWDRSEVEALIAHGGTPVSLGRQVLRTETAPLFVLSVVRYLSGT